MSDITYMQTDEGQLYLAGIMDLCGKEIVGQSMGSRMTKELVIECYDNAPLKSFWGKLKQEWHNDKYFRTRKKRERRYFAMLKRIIIVNECTQITVTKHPRIIQIRNYKRQYNCCNLGIISVIQDDLENLMFYLYHKGKQGHMDL